MPDRNTAMDLLTEWVSSPGLLKHMLCVEAAMRASARKYGRNEEEWGIAGLLHDFDYEKYPHPDPVQKTGHPFEGIKILKEKGYSAEITEAILGHASYSGVERRTQMAKCLFAVDELSGFIVAIAYMRPDKLDGITPEVVKKYLKREKFAEKVSRAEIAQGIAELGGEEDAHYELVLTAIKSIAKEIGF